MKRPLILLLAAAFLLISAISTASEPKIVFSTIPPDAPWTPAKKSLTLPVRDHPFLLLNSADFTRLKQKVKTEPWAQKSFLRLKRKADTALKGPLKIPDIPGEWTHQYVCKTCGIDLERKDGKNVCPRCGRVYAGWPYDGVVAGRVHSQNIENANTLGLAWQLTGNPDYAKRARAILLGYADRYAQFPDHDYRGTTLTKGAKLFAQTLDESVHMISFAWAYDLVYNSPEMTGADRRHVEYNLFRPAALIIRRNDMGVSNWQSWHNAALAAIGFTLNDPAIVDHAINGKSGIRFQMKHSVLPDGFWYEGTASYHFYALEALQDQAMAMKAAGMDLYREPEFRSMYEAPLDYVFPDGSFPAVNDSGGISLQGQGDFYEVAYAWYRSPEFAAAAEMAGRDSRTALLWGADKLPDNKLEHGKSHDFPGLGAVMLREGGHSKNPLAVHLDYGPHGGAHGHADKLSIIFFANGREIMPDPGRLRYAAPLHHKWYKKSLAHNTVTIDGKNQNPAEGRLISTSFDGPVQLATASCDTAYKGVKLTRSIALAPEYMLDVTTGSSDKKHTWDLAYHVFGKPVTDLLLKPGKLKQHADGYEILKNIRTVDVYDKSWSIRFDDELNPGNSLLVEQANTGTRKVILADGFSGEDVTTCPVALSRQNGKHALWITLSVPTKGQAVKADWNCLKTENGWAINIKLKNKTDHYTVGTNGILKHIGNQL